MTLPTHTRLHFDSPIGSSVTDDLGWHLWRVHHNRPFPPELGAGFRYLVCEQPPGGRSRHRVTSVLATVTDRLNWVQVRDLRGAHRAATRHWGPLQSLDEWLANRYHDTKDGGPFWFTMWQLTAVAIEPVDIRGPFEHTGWLEN